MASIELNSNLVIRRPNPDDFLGIKEFVSKITENTRNTYGEHDWKDTPLDDASYDDLIDTFGAGNILLGIIDGILSGIVVLTQKNAEKFKHVGNLTLSLLSDDLMDPLGKEMISRMILACKGKGVIRKVNLRVREDLFKIQEIYKSLGFYEEGSLARDVCLNGMFYSTLLYGRSID
ncbi:hypothetical protein [Proteiniclasticum sp.]|uniref:hypothetical protein n=1 Tax=Proteiniclasticum sp. TaxID=2053595 RepID=UPI002896511D|nr:hypothetical protein [Proteiniclasticum sp.]